MTSGRAPRKSGRENNSAQECAAPPQKVAGPLGITVSDGSAEMLRLALDAAGQGTWNYRIDTGGFDLDAKACTLLGLAKGEKLSWGQFLNDLVHPADRAQLDEAVHTGTRPGGRGRFKTELRVTPNCGGLRWLSVCGRTLFADDNGESRRAVRIIGTARDITERKHTEEALRRRGARLAAVLKAAGLGAWEWHIPTGHLELDTRWADMLGYGLDEFEEPSEAFRILLHPDDRACVEQAIADHFSGKADIYNIEVRLRHKAGHYVWILTSGRVIERDSEGRPVLMIGTHQDITQRKHAEERLRVSEARLAAAVKGGRLGIFDYHPVSGRLDWDDTVRHLWGVPADETVTFETCTAGIHPDDRPHVRRAVQKSFDPGGERSYAADYRVVNRQSGDVRWVHAQGDVTFENGRAVRLVGATADITLQKEIEARLRESEARLASLLDQLSIFVGVLSLEGILQQTNRAPLEAAGIELKDVLGKPFDETYWWSWNTSVQKQLRADIRRAAAGEAVRRDAVMRMAGGRLITTDLQIAPFRGEGGRIIGLIASNIDIDDRVRAEEALRQREARLTAVLAAADLGAWHWNLRTGVVEMNPRWVGMIGYEWGELPQREETFFNVLHPDDADRVRNALNDHFSGRTENYSVAIRMRHKKGHYVWVLTSGRLIERDSEGRPLIMTGTHQDITERKRAEDLLRASEDRLAAAVKGGNLGVFDYDPVSGRLDWDETIRRVWGIPPDETVTYEKFSAGVHPDDRDRVNEAVRASLDPGGTHSYAADYRVINRQTGELRWVHAQGDVTFEGRTAVRLVGAASDITRQKKNEDALRQREQRLAAVLRAADLGSWHWNIRTGEVEFNSRFAEMLGYSLSELEPHYNTFRRHLHPDDVKRVRTALREHFGHESDLQSVEVRMRHKDGHWIWVLASGRVIERDREGRPLVMTGVNQDISGRVAAAQALQESEARFRETFENAAVGIAHLGMDGRWLRVNERLCGITGYSRDELLKMTFRDITLPEDLQAEMETYDDMVQGRIPHYQFEKRYLRKNGDVVWVNVTRSLQMDSKGTPRHIIAIVEDISTRKQAEEALRESEERLAIAMKAGGLGVWDYDPQTDEVNWDETAHALWGTQPDEPITYDTFVNGINPEDRQTVEKVVREALDPDCRRPCETEYRVINKRTGTERWVYAHGSVIFENDTAVRMIGTVADETSRVEAEEALRKSEEQFRLLADNMSQLAWMTDARGWIYWYNKRWFDFTGTTLDEMEGWGWTKVHHPDHVDRVVTKISRCFETGEPWEDTFPLRGKDGEYRWYLSRAQPVRNKKGRIVRWFGTNTDITERLRAEQHREMLVNELNHRVKNTLAVVQGIAQQTFRGTGAAGQEANKAFQGRLSALAAAHNLLTQSNWESASLEDVACQTVKAACARGMPVRMNGPDVILRPRQAITLAMALHELCTNAVKYGSLSSDRGQLEINWTVFDDGGEKSLKLVWREHHGPPVTQPQHRGFGTRMIKDALANEFNGEVTMDFRREGLVCTIEGRLAEDGGNTY